MGENAEGVASSLPLTVGDASLGEIVGREFYFDAITWHDSNEVLSHSTSDMRQNLIPCLQLHPKTGRLPFFNRNPIMLPCSVFPDIRYRVVPVGGRITQAFGSLLGTFEGTDKVGGARHRMCMKGAE